MKSVRRLTLPCLAAGALCLACGVNAADGPAGPVIVPAPAQSAGKAKAKPAKRPPMATYWGGLALSPHGKHLAWITFSKQGLQLQVANADATHARDVQMPAGIKHCRPGRALWSPTGSELAFLSNCGNKDKAQQDVFLVDVGSGKMVARRLTHLDGYVHGLAWGPQGKQLGILYVVGDTHPVAATAASKPRVGVIGVHGVEHQQMAVVDAATGAVRTMTPKSLFVYEFAFSPNARRVTYVAAPPPGADHWWKAKLYTQAVGAGSQPQELVNTWTATGPLHHLQMAHPRFSPDGKSVAFIGGLMSDQGVTGGDIYVVPATGGKAVDVTPGIHISPAWFTWTGNEHLLVSSYAGAGSQIDLFTLHGTQPSTHKTLLKTPSALRGLAVAHDASRFAFVGSTFNKAPEIYAGSLARDASGQPQGLTRPVQPITHANADIKPRWGKGVEIDWHNEGFDVSGWLLLPLDYDPHKSYPMIVSVHGGPVWAYRASWPRGQTASFSRAGYFVFMPNPRGSLGQGAAFTQAIRRNMGYGDLRDILSGINAIEKKYSVDDSRLGLIGWSYGGFMAMFAPTQTHRFKAAVAGAGLSDWKSYYGENMIDQWMLPFFGASVYDAPAAYAKSSAINFIKKDTTPTLIIAGQFDKECPAAQSLEMWRGLRTMGVPTTLVIYAGEGHGFHKRADSMDVARRTKAWFKQYLKPQAP